MNAHTPERPPVPGTRPEGARGEAEAAAQVRAMFSRIAPRYDLLNRLLSLSFDRAWRRRTARHFAHLLARPGARVLDLCCGTGDLTFALARVAGKQARTGASALILGADFARPMLTRAREKWSRQRRSGANAQDASAVRLAFLEGDALRLPFADASFDVVTAAFGFRNLANYERGLAEIHRLLRPGGEAGILEFAEPRALGPLYRFYFTKLLPRIGGRVSGDPTAYAYLPASVMKFPSPANLAAQMTRIGFLDAHFELWTGGIVALHSARK